MDEIQVIEKYKPLVHKIASRYTKQAHGMQLDDLVQEGNIGLIRALRSYDEKRGKFFWYAYVCIRNEIRSAIDRNSGFPKSNSNKDLRSYNHVYHDDLDKIRDEIDKMSEREQQIITKRLNGFSYTEIASSLDISRQRVEQIWNKIVERLRSINRN